MVIATIDSLLALDWPAFEIVVVDNNTSDAALWQPVEAHVQACLAAGLKTQLRFFHLPQWPGYKAGALNFALEKTDPRAEWIAVVDADYLVKSNWLRALGGYFSDPTVGVVQSPQAHRDWSQSTLSRMMNWEYDGFFRIGMHHRQERDAAIQHGTMTVIRASALRAVNGWETACVCEDSELGLRLVQQGLRLVYVDEVLGSGLVPTDFAAYQRQRRRWAQGAMQILRTHRQALFGRSSLSLAQRYHFVAGWLPWVGDGLHLFFQSRRHAAGRSACCIAPEVFWPADYPFCRAAGRFFRHSPAADARCSTAAACLVRPAMSPARRWPVSGFRTALHAASLPVCSAKVRCLPSRARASATAHSNRPALSLRCARKSPCWRACWRAWWLWVCNPAPNPMLPAGAGCWLWACRRYPMRRP